MYIYPGSFVDVAMIVLTGWKETGGTVIVGPERCEYPEYVEMAPTASTQ